LDARLAGTYMFPIIRSGNTIKMSLGRLVLLHFPRLRFLEVLTDVKEVKYDDFIANFTASKFNASHWLDVFDKAGAKYFVFVTVSSSLYILYPLDTKEELKETSRWICPL
jgi:hypothetical protein